jgi:hypothetical protein
MFGGETALVLFLVVLPASIIAVLLLSYRYYKRRSLKQLRDKESEIEQAYNELQTIWNRDRYLEHKTITKWLKDWSHLEPIVSINVDNKFAGSELRTKISRLFSVFDNTEEEVSERNELFIQNQSTTTQEAFVFNANVLLTKQATHDY